MIMNFESSKHPCFSAGVCAKFARIHLPVAPECNIMCNYCRRRFDCVNESRPGVASAVLSPEEALARFTGARKALPLAVAGIAGPGDALASPERVFETFRLIRKADPDVLFCISTNGLLLADYAERLAAAGVNHITVTVNAVNPETAMKIYRFVNYNGRRFTKKAAAELLLERQIEGIRLAAGAGAAVKVNIVYIKGINDGEIPDIVLKTRDAGAALCNIMQLIPVKGTLFEDLPLTSRREISEIRKKCENILPQMKHCRQCRADAAGLLGDDKSIELFAGNAENKNMEHRKTESAAGQAGQRGEGTSGGEKAGRVRFYAAASRNGLIVDKHFGQAEEFYIYKYEEDGNGGKVSFAEKREIPQYCMTDDCGAKTDKIGKIAAALSDCEALFVLRIGEVPRHALSERGIKVILSYDYVENAILETEGVRPPQ